MVAFPDEIPLTMPEEDPIVATPGAPESHVPPPATVNVVLAPSQIDVTPEIVEGDGLIVAVACT